MSTAPPLRTVTADALAALQALVRGQVVGPDDDQYEAARRIWNGMIVTSFEFQAHSVGPDVSMAVVFCPKRAKR